MKKPFTKQEQEIMDLLVEAHSKFIKLKQMHSNDIMEWVDGIHKCQTILKSRGVTRDYPDIFHNEGLSGIDKFSCNGCIYNNTTNDICGSCGLGFANKRTA